MTAAFLIASAFLASAVEFVEALTIVLAMGLTRGWRSALAGTAAAVVVLCGIAALAGYSLVNRFPESLAQLVIGTLLLLFGLRWLRKAILRAAGLKALHDEDETFREELEAGRAARARRRFGLDAFGFAVSFKGVLLEGIEVIFIVVTFGVNAGSMRVAVAGAAVGGLIVVAAGVALHRPLARVPENAMKMTVGLLLSTFGTFWAVEGLGFFSSGEASVEWPGGDASLPFVLAAWCLLAWASVRLLRGGPVEQPA
jgi:uncharacterized membrane protein